MIFIHFCQTFINEHLPWAKVGNWYLEQMFKHTHTHTLEAVFCLSSCLSLEFPFHLWTWYFGIDFLGKYKYLLLF